MRSFRVIIQAVVTAGFVLLGMTGCMVGPSFHKPPFPIVSSYTETPLPKRTARTPAKGGQSQTFVINDKISAQWWTLYHSRKLNALIEQGLQNSPTLDAACAALRQAIETLNAQIGNLLLPAFNYNLSATRLRFAPSSLGSSQPGSVFNFFNSNISVSYTFDVFGGNRREIEALAAQADYQQFQLIGAYVTLTSNIVATTVAIASYEAQVITTKALIAAEEHQLNLMEKQYRLGAIAQQTVLTQRTLLEQTRATLPILQNNASQSRHALSVLVGAFPDQPLHVPTLDSLHLPKKLPISLPSRLVQQRPDVRAAEELLHAASAQIGVATANLLPQFTLTGAYGGQSGTFSNLFSPQSVAWNIGTQLTQPIFHGGALLAQRRYAIAAYDQAGAQYKQTVLQAFQNVADSLRAIETDARRYRALKAAERAAYGAWKLIEQQYHLGGVDFLALLIAEQQYRQAVLLSIQGQASRYTDTAALFQALGGGWWNHG